MMMNVGRGALDEPMLLRGVNAGSRSKNTIAPIASCRAWVERGRLGTDRGWSSRHEAGDRHASVVAGVSRRRSPRNGVSTDQAASTADAVGVVHGCRGLVGARQRSVALRLVSGSAWSRSDLVGRMRVRAAVRGAG